MIELHEQLVFTTPHRHYAVHSACAFKPVFINNLHGKQLIPLACPLSTFTIFPGCLFSEHCSHEPCTVSVMYSPSPSVVSHRRMASCWVTTAPLSQYIGSICLYQACICIYLLPVFVKFSRQTTSSSGPCKYVS